MKRLKVHKSFGGETSFWEHQSSVTQTSMKFSSFVPSGEIKGCLIWLSGLTCTEENFITKAGAQKYLREKQLMVIAPDTSPRGLSLPGEHDSYDFGSGAGFYLNATTQGYKDHYRMEDYVVHELYELIGEKFNQRKISIFGHSMGGHGALYLGLKYPDRFKSISAFSPITNPSATPWGVKAFTGYLGENREEWLKHDATQMIISKRRHQSPILIHQGTLDEFLERELKYDQFLKTCSQEGQMVIGELCEGYDHSYYFISSFIEEHIDFHSTHLAKE